MMMGKFLERSAAKLGQKPPTWKRKQDTNLPFANFGGHLFCQPARWWCDDGWHGQISGPPGPAGAGRRLAPSGGLHGLQRRCSVTEVRYSTFHPVPPLLGSFCSSRTGFITTLDVRERERERSTALWVRLTFNKRKRGAVLSVHDIVLAEFHNIVLDRRNAAPLFPHIIKSKRHRLEFEVFRHS